MKKVLKNKKGFTLIEMLVVVLIIGILAAIALPQYNLSVKVTRVKSMLPLARSLMEAQKRYFLANGVYTSNLKLLDITQPDKCDEAGYRCYYGNVTMQAGGSNGIVSTSDLPSIYVFYDKKIQCLAWGEDDNINHEICKRATKTNFQPNPIIGATYYTFANY